MESRGQKRAEIVDDLPADKRACNSLEFRPSSSSSPVEPHLNSTSLVPETSVADMDTSSSNSGSSHSDDDDEPERDLAYGSCDSNNGGLRHGSLRDYQKRRSSGDHGRIKSALNGLSEGIGNSEQLAALTELCEVLSFCTEDSLSSTMVELLAPVLVRLARQEGNADVMLLSIRALHYLCDVFPRASSFLVRHDAIPALCQRLMAIEYMDLAEQCFQALGIISRDQPLACLQAGAIMAVLGFIDFFPTSVQRIALLTVVNICKKLPTESPSLFMEAVPKLCNLLQYEDRQLVENVAICLIKIAERVSESSEMLDELCKHGLVNQVTRLIQLNSSTTLSQSVYNGLIALLVKLSSNSFLAVKTLYELDITGILKDILDAHDLSHGISSPHLVDGNGNKVHEVLKLLNELLPNITRDPNAQQQVLDKESFLVNHPDLLHKFGSDILPILSQVVNSGANLYICYGCLSVINKLVYFSKSDEIVELLKNANIPSFLAGVFTRKDHHVLLLALHIAEIILQKHSDAFLNSFIKEGVLFAIEALLTPEKCSRQMFPLFNGIQLPCDSGHKSSSKTVLRCLCYAFDTGRMPTSSETGKCKIDNNNVHNLAKHIKTSYFSLELSAGEKGLTDVFQNFRALSSALMDLTSANLDASSQDEEKFYGILHQIMMKLNEKEPVSTFEFIESGIVKSLANYLSGGWCLRDKVEIASKKDYCNILEKRFEVFSRLFSLSSDLAEEMPVSILIQKLQGALSSLENLPIVLNHISRHRNIFALVPSGRCTSYSCLRVRFTRGGEETCLSDYSEDIVTVDPFSTLEAIEGFLLPKVKIRRGKQSKSTAQVVYPMESEQPPSPQDANFSQGESSDSMQPESEGVDLQMLQEDEVNLSHVSPEITVTLGQGHLAESISQNAIQNAPAAQVVQVPSRTCVVHDENAVSLSNVDNAQKLTFYLEGQPLDRRCTLYQAILQQKIKSEDESNLGGKLWSQVYTLTYTLAAESKDDYYEESHSSGEESSLLDKTRSYMENTSFIRRIFSYELPSDLDTSSATYAILFLLKVLEGLNRFTFHLMSHKRLHAFADGLVDNLNDLKVVVRSLPQIEFVSSKLTEKLEQQMRDSYAVSAGGMPMWCNQLMSSCPFLFGFEARCKYFRLIAFGPHQVRPQPSSPSSNFSRDRRQTANSSVRKKFTVYRDQILESAAQLMELNAHIKEPIEVVYNEEVGTGLGPTLEFYTLVSHEFQMYGLGMWRGDHSASEECFYSDNSGAMMSAFGIFPRPWSPTSDASDGSQFSQVIKKFTLLGQVVARALQDGRVLDISFSKAFYKNVLQQELNLYDIQSFDPELGRTLLEFEALVNRKMCSGSAFEEDSSSTSDACFRDTRIEDLCLDFTLPGYADYNLPCYQDTTLVNMTNLQEYVALVVDATINSGISRQMEAFKSGFNQIFPIEHLQIFTEEELECLLCGERNFWAFNEFLDHIKLDHGYTVSSPPIVNLLEIVREFNYEQQRGFLQFVTGAPRLPPGGLASLNPKLTIVRKHCSGSVDADLPSVMTCANYLKLPPYSSKEKMKEKLLYAITEGQGSFHLS